MILQYILIIYTHSSKILYQKLLKCNICKLNVRKKFVRKRNDSILNIIISCKCVRIELISSSSCNCCMNYHINFHNFKISSSTIEIKVKHLRASEITCLIQLIMRDNRICKLCKQIYLYVLEKIIAAINKIEKIIIIITIKSLKYYTKLNIIHTTKKNTNQIIQYILNTSNDKRNKIVARMKWEKL